MHLMEIIFFSLYQVIVRPTKIIKNLLKDLKILIFIVIFNIKNELKFSLKNIGLGDQLLIIFFSKILILKISNSLHRTWRPKTLSGLFKLYFNGKMNIFFLERFDQFSTLKNDFENQSFEMFEEVVHNSGKSDEDMILWKNAYFH